MLRIYRVCVEVIREVAPLIEEIERFDRDQARQLRRSVKSIGLNVAEGCGCRGGTRRQRYLDALGSARESLANLEIAAALGYVGPIGSELRNRFDHVIGVLVKLVRRPK